MQAPFSALCHLIVVCASSSVPLSCVSTSLMAFKEETQLYLSSGTFTDMSDMSHRIAAETLGRGFRSALRKCLNSLPPKKKKKSWLCFSLLRHQSFCGSSADGGKFVLLALSCEDGSASVVCFCLRYKANINIWVNAESKDGKWELAEEQRVKLGTQS